MKIWVKQGGLMEDPDWHWEPVGEAEGNTLQEACNNLAAQNAGFAKYYNPETLSFWGWQLKLESDMTREELATSRKIRL